MQSRTIPLRRLADDDLTVLATLGSLPAYDELIRRYRPAVVLAAQQIVRRRAVAEEVAQETFLAAFRALPSLGQPGRFGAWLRAIARRQAWRTANREEAHRGETLDTLDQVVFQRSHELGADPACDAERRLARELVFLALERLPDEQQEALLLHAYEGWTVPQIARFLGVPDATVRGRIFRARQSVRAHITRMEENP